MAYIDFHVHIDYYKDFMKKYNEYEAGKIYTLFVTNLPEIYEACIKKFPISKYIKIALGYNPMLVSEYNFDNIKFDKYFDEAEYIGEVGLDYSKDFLLHKEKQNEIFKYISNRVGHTSKIMCVHSRSAIVDVLDTLESQNVKNAVFHWYTDSLDQIDRIVDNGYYFSINPSMLRNAKGRSIIKAIPLERILFESDGPFGRLKNEIVTPLNIKESYFELGRVIGIEDLEYIVMTNFKELLSRK